jgi:hypothetical protein
MTTIAAPASLVAYAFPHIQWDALGSLRLTAQETALLRMAETNPIDYTLADSRDASMYARVLLKLLAEASAAGAGTGTNNLLFAFFLVQPASAFIDSVFFSFSHSRIIIRRSFHFHREMF